MIPLGVLASARVAAGGGWTPASLPGLFAWFDASDPSTITEFGGAVSQWADKSNGAWHAIHAAGAKPITGTNTQNGLNVLAFTKGVLASGVFATVPQPFTVAYVGSFAANGNKWQPAIAMRDGSYATYQSADKDWVIYNGAAIYAAGADTSAHVFTSTHSGSSSLIRIDGNQVAGGNAGINGMIFIGLGGVSRITAFTGWLAEVVVLSGPISGADLTNLESYLTTKWGIA